MNNHINPLVWNAALTKISPLIFKISTPSGSGTGFLISYSNTQGLCGVATAYHVIAQSHEWEESIKILHFESKEIRTLKPNERRIIVYPEQDLAFIMFNKGTMSLNTSYIPDLVPPGKHLLQGIKTGWCGFPSVAPNELCFFSGYVSCVMEKGMSYLIDGVAINGVSGSPAFHINPEGKPVILGVISAYIPNTATGNILPGVSYVRSIETYQKDLSDFRTLDQVSEEQNTEIKASKKTEDIKKEDKGVSEK